MIEALMAAALMRQPHWSKLRAGTAEDMYFRAHAPRRRSAPRAAWLGRNGGDQSAS